MQIQIKRDRDTFSGRKTGWVLSDRKTSWHKWVYVGSGDMNRVLGLVAAMIDPGIVLDLATTTIEDVRRLMLQDEAPDGG